MAALISLLIAGSLGACCILLFLFILIIGLIGKLIGKAMPKGEGQKTIGEDDITEGVIDGEFKEV